MFGRMLGEGGQVLAQGKIPTSHFSLGLTIPWRDALALEGGPPSVHALCVN